MLMSSVSSPYLLFPEKSRSRSSHFNNRNDLSNIKPGHCPKCRLEFKSPMALPCGHSICHECCEELLIKCNGRSVPKRNCRVLMGVNMVNKYKKQHRSGKIQKTLSIISEQGSHRPLFRSPACLVCHAAPSYQAPIPNLALEKMMAWEKFKANSQRKTTLKRPNSRNACSPTPSSTSSSGFEENDEHIKPPTPAVDFGIRKCNIAVIGAAGVGKSKLMRTQHYNKMFFGKIGEVADYDLEGVNPAEELQAKYMIEILDNNDIDGDLEEADAVILTYACNDHSSFVIAFKLYEEIKRRGYSKLPLALVSTKCDIDFSRREIKREEAESLARHIGCPHMELSAAKNIGVNEVFTRLIKLIEDKTDNTLTLN